MPDIFCPSGMPLSVKTVSTWRAKMNSNINDERPKGAKGKQKRGRKPSRPLGEVPAPVPGKSHSIIPHALLCVLASMIVAQYQAGFTITTALLAPLVLAFLETHDITWKPAKCWYRRFLHRIGLSWRRTTKAARSTPADLAETRRMFLRRVIYICRRYNVPPSLFINMDESGIFLFPLQKRTWGPAGAKQVAIVGNDDKRQFTLVVGITASGKLAGRSQIIWAGETTGCHPKGDEYKAFDKLLFHSHSASHWTTEDTLPEYVQDLFDNHVVPTIKQQGGDVEHQKWVLLYDCYSVHRSHDVLCELKTRFPTLIVLFVPASCTGELQPLDLAFFSIFKSGLARLCAMWMTDIAKTQILRGVQPDAITYDLRLSTLRLPFVTWVHTMLTKISAEKTVALTKGWDMSGISIVWSNDEADKDECDELYDEARQWEREGKLFQVAGGRSRDAAVGGLLEQQVLQPPRNRKRKRDDADTEEDAEYSADEEEEEENDPAWADMMAEMAEEDDDVVANDSDDENQLPDDLASCFKPCTTRSGRTTRPPVRS